MTGTKVRALDREYLSQLNRGLIEIYERTIERCAWQAWYTYNDKRARTMFRDERAKQNKAALEVVAAQMRAHDAIHGYVPTEDEAL